MNLVPKRKKWIRFIQVKVPSNQKSSKESVYRLKPMRECVFMPAYAFKQVVFCVLERQSVSESEIRRVFRS